MLILCMQKMYASSCRAIRVFFKAKCQLFNHQIIIKFHISWEILIIFYNYNSIEINHCIRSKISQALGKHSFYFPKVSC